MQNQQSEISMNPSTKQETEFSKPDQSGGPAAGFQVCP
jgi:hypothetical protein